MIIAAWVLLVVLVALVAIQMALDSRANGPLFIGAIFLLTVFILSGCRLTDPSPNPPPEQTCWEQQGDTVRVCEVGDTLGLVGGGA